MPKFQVIINFAIENYDGTPIARDHRLTPGGRHIENRQAPEAQVQSIVFGRINALIIWSAPGHQGGHVSYRLRECRSSRLPVKRQNACDTTHLLSILLQSGVGE